MRLRSTLAAGAALITALAASAVLADTTLLNVSYDPTRELYKAVNEAFIKDWKAKSGEDVNIEQSHGGSGKQARAVIDGLQADVVTLALQGDIDQVAKAGLLNPKWRDASRQQQLALHLDHRLPRPQGQSQGPQGLGRSGQGGRRGHHAEPEDLGRRAMELSRGLGLRRRQIRPRRGEEQGVRQAALRERSGARYRRARLDHAPSFSAASAMCCWRGRTKPSSRSRSLVPTNSTSSCRRSRSGRSRPVAVVDKVVDAKGTRKVAEAYLNFLYTPEAQKLIAKNYYRAFKPEFADPEDAKRFPDVKLVTIDDPLFGGWDKGDSRSISPTAASSTRSISPNRRTRGETRMAGARGLALKRPSAIPGFGLALGFTLTYL